MDPQVVLAEQKKDKSFHRRYSSKTGAISTVAFTIVVVIVLMISAITISYYYGIIPTGPQSKSSRFSVSASETTSTINLIPTTETFNSTYSHYTTLQCSYGNWTTFHCDSSRNGTSPNEPSLHSPSLAWQSTSLDGNIYAEPIIGMGMVYIATENDSIYALNETNGNIVWRTNVGTPVPHNALPCGDIFPLGITGTPVLDISSGELYVVAEVTGYNHFLFGLNMKTGAIDLKKTVNPPVPNQDLSAIQQRPALGLSDGMVYIEYGGLDGDCGTYHGWVLGAQLNSSNLYSFEVAPSGSRGGIWEVSGPAIDSSGDLYVATGNSDNATNFDYGDGVVKLSPSLHVESYFAPSDWAQLNQNDNDLGTTGPVLFSGKNMLFQVGKEGVGYILNNSNLGSMGPPIYSAQVCDQAYSADAFDGRYIYVPCTNGLFALSLVANGNQSSFSNAWNTDPFTSGAPIVAGNAVWVVDTDNATLFALGLTNGASLFSFNLSTVMHFQSVSAASGYVFVTGGNSQAYAISIAP